MGNSIVVQDKSNLPRRARRPDETHFDRIWQSIYEPKLKVELSPVETRMRERYEYIWVYMRNISTHAELSKRVQRKFGVSKVQANVDIRETARLFGDVVEDDRKVKRAIMSHILERAIKKAYKQEEWAELERLILRYDKINGLSKEESNLVEELVKANPPAAIVFNADPETLKKQAEALMRDVKDVDYEPVDDTPGADD